MKVQIPDLHVIHESLEEAERAYQQLRSWEKGIRTRNREHGGGVAEKECSEGDDGSRFFRSYDCPAAPPLEVVHFKLDSYAGKYEAVIHLAIEKGCNLEGFSSGFARRLGKSKSRLIWKPWKMDGEGAIYRKRGDSAQLISVARFSFEKSGKSGRAIALGGYGAPDRDVGTFGDFEQSIRDLTVVTNIFLDTLYSGNPAWVMGNGIDRNTVISLDCIM